MDNINESIECFICFDNNELIKLTSIKNEYWSDCECDNYVHKLCIDKWLSIKGTCPLCREKYISKSQYYYKATKRFFKKVNYYGITIIVCLCILYLYLLISDILIELDIHESNFINDSTYHD